MNLLLLLGRDFVGPGQYSMPSTLDRQKAFSFGLKVNKKVKSDGPSPNSYRTDTVDFAQKPSYSFGSRFEQKSRSVTPGMYRHHQFAKIFLAKLVHNSNFDWQRLGHIHRKNVSSITIQPIHLDYEPNRK